MAEPLLQPEAVGPSRNSGGAGGVRWRRAVWPMMVAGLIFVASSRERVAGPGVTAVDDKIAHFAVYGLLGTLVCRMGGGTRSAVWSLVVVSAFGASDEWHQSLVPGRYMDLADWIADTLGAGVAVILYSYWPRYRQILEQPLGRGRRENEKG